jgi:hypothetical protein
MALPSSLEKVQLATTASTVPEEKVKDDYTWYEDENENDGQIPCKNRAAVRETAQSPPDGVPCGSR